MEQILLWGICGDMWRCMEICGDMWRYVGICGDVWRCVEMCGDILTYIQFPRHIKNNKIIIKLII